jgi:uncharacterized protein YndB with AHSA1/START domain
MKLTLHFTIHLFMKKILKYTLLGLLSLVVIILIAAAIMPSEYAVERHVVIQKSRNEVFAFARMLGNQDKYSVWEGRDPNIKKSYRGTDGQVGAVYRWESQNEEVGVGEQEITRIEENKRIESALRFEAPFESNDQAYMAFEDAPNGATKVVWGFNGKMPYPFNLMLPFMGMEEMLGKDFQDGLDKMKAYTEANL